MVLWELISAEVASTAAARWMAKLISEAVGSRGVCTLALSGGRTPQHMLRTLATMTVPWHALHVFQVDERFAPRGDFARNLTALERLLLRKVAIPAHQVHAMPVDLPSLRQAVTEYSKTLRATAGEPPVLDIVHLGLGPDGHTASLFPDDTLLGESVRDVAVSRAYAGHRRLTLTLPCLARARNRVWLVTGAGKSAALANLLEQDERFPASRLVDLTGTFFVDRDAASQLPDHLHPKPATE